MTADGLEVAIRQSKTGQNARGEVVPLPYGSHPDTCPVRVGPGVRRGGPVSGPPRVGAG